MPALDSLDGSGVVVQYTLATLFLNNSHFHDLDPLHYNKYMCIYFSISSEMYFNEGGQIEIVTVLWIFRQLRCVQTAFKTGQLNNEQKMFVGIYIT